MKIAMEKEFVDANLNFTETNVNILSNLKKNFHVSEKNEQKMITKSRI